MTGWLWRRGWWWSMCFLSSHGQHSVGAEVCADPSLSREAWQCCDLQFRSVTQSFSALCSPIDCSTPGFPVHHQLLELMQTHIHWVGDAIQHLILCCPLLLPPSVFPSIRIFSNKLVLCIRWSKYWSFSFIISPSNEYSGLISSRMDWLDLLAVQGTLKSLLQHRSSNASIFWHSAFFIIPLSHPYMTTGKTITWTGQTFVSKVMSLPFTMLSRLVIAFLPKKLVISRGAQVCADSYTSRTILWHLGK